MAGYNVSVFFNSLEDTCSERHFLNTGSESVIRHIKQNSTPVRFGFYLGVEDSFFVVPHTQLLEAVNGCIETNGMVSFHNQCGITVLSVLELLRL